MRTVRYSRRPRLRRDRLDYSRPGRHADECEIVVGLDFGTSCTKVVMRAPELPGSSVFPIARARSTGSPWLWSTGMICQPNGNFLLLPGKWSEDLKRPLLDTDDPQSREAVRAEPWAAAFLGMVLRHARESLLLGESRIFGAYRALRWAMNIGFPSAEVGQETVLRRRFRRLGRAAWALSLEELVTLDRAQTALRDAKDGPDLLEECPVEAFPEIAAGAQAYARGTSRRNGLHILLDIGATTVDAGVVRIWEDREEDDWSFMATRVAPLGTTEWNERRLAALGRRSAGAAPRLKRRDPLDPEAGDLDLPTRLVDSDALARIRNEFADELRRRVVGYVLEQTFDFKDWMWNQRHEGKEFPVLLMGGGSKSSHYRHALRHVLKELRDQFFRGGLPPVEVIPPLSNRYEALRRGAHRLAVAFGLSFHAFDLGRIRLPHETPDRPVDVTRPKRPPFVDKEQV